MTESKEDPTVTQGEFSPQTIAGMYLIINMATRNLLDLLGNKRDDGAAVVTYPYLPYYGTVSAHWDIRNYSDATYVIRNIWGGSVLSLAPSENKTTGRRHKEGEKSQLWVLKDEGEGCYSIQNAEPPRVLEVENSSLEAMAPVIGAGCEAVKDSQLWSLERRDRTVDEVKGIIEASSILKGLALGWPTKNVRFITLAPRKRNELYEVSKIAQRRIGAGTIEPKDLAVKFKETVWTWATEHVGIEEYRFLFGVICGSTHKGPKVYNWQLSQDLYDIVFIDPLSGREYTSKHLQHEGFQSEWGTC